MKGGINDASSGNIYYDCTISGTYNKTGGSSTSVPSGYVEFTSNSNVDNLIMNLTGNTIVKTLGTGTMYGLNQSNGIC